MSNPQATGSKFGSLTRQYILAKPADPKRFPRPATLYPHNPGLLELRPALAKLVAANEPIHLDFETTGLDAADPTQSVVGVGLANAAGVWYFDARQWRTPGNEWYELQRALYAVGWMAFNAPFDGAWLWRYNVPAYDTPNPRLAGCTQALYRLLATEGYTGQQWNLESAVDSILGWGTQNQKNALAAMLVKHGIVNHSGHPIKGRMSELAALEPEGFAKYCAEDADASWQLWATLYPQAAQHPGLRQYLADEWPCMLQLLIDQYLTGITIDRPALQRELASLDDQIAAAVVALREDPLLAPHVATEEAKLAAEFFAPHLARRRVRAEPAVEVALNPPCTQDAIVPVAYEGEWYWFKPSKSKSLRPWQRDAGGYWYCEDVVASPVNVGLPAPRVNWNSDHWVRKLLFEYMYRWERLEPEYPDRPGKIRVHLTADDYVDVSPTDKGQPPCGKEILPALGRPGQLLTNLAVLTKRREYVVSYLEASARDGKIHPQFRAPGTNTGRLSGGSER